MNFDKRRSVAREMLVEFLAMLSAPRGLDEDGQAKLVDSIAGALARKMPVTGEEKYRDDLMGVFNAVLDSHSSHSWPPQGLFVEHIPKSIGGSLAPATFAPDRKGLMAKRMNAGEGVPEYAVWGFHANAIVASGEVSRELLDRYRKGSVEAFIDAYRGDAARIAEERLGPVVREYFGADQ